MTSWPTSTDPVRTAPGLVSTLVPALVLALLLGSGCRALDGDEPEPGRQAERLAAGLSSDDLSGVSFYHRSADDVAGRYHAVVAGLGGLRPEVTAGDAQESGGRVTVDLDWRWPVGGDTWSYRSQATLLKTSGGWQVRWDPTLVHPDLQPEEELELTPIATRRGAVLGAGDTDIVVPRRVTTFGIDRSKVRTDLAAGSARALAAAVDVDPRPYVARVLASGPQAFVPAITLRQDAVPDTLVSAARTIPGVRHVAGTLPLAPTKEFAAPLLGSVGEVTAEMLEEHPDRYRPGDQVGLSGLQARYDDRMRSIPGVVVDRVQPDGSEHELFRVGGHQGEPLRLTLDVALQLRAEQLLAHVGPPSAIVALRPSTGDVLVAANGPGNDGYNYATYGQVAPGSTFKTVSALGLTRRGLTAGDVLPCPPTLAVDGKSFKNYSDYPSSALGSITFETAFANSCNTSFISEAGELSGQDLVGAAADLGVGVDHDLGFPAFFGTVPAPESRTEHAADLIGQGRVLVSPLAMAAVAASVQAGHTVVPRLLADADPADTAGAALSPDEADALRELMRSVVTQGSGAALADVPGPPVLAKTGTAEFETEGEILTHAWMIAAQGDLAVAVYVDVGESGSHTAGPILEEFLRSAG